MTACGQDKVRVGIVIEVDDSPITVYIWAHLVATLVDELRESRPRRRRHRRLPGLGVVMILTELANRCSTIGADSSSISVAANIRSHLRSAPSKSSVLAAL